jgi:hypothetical protein
MNMLNIKGKLSSNHQVIAEAFNNHFLSIAEEINKNSSNNERNDTTAKHLLSQSFKNPFPALKLNSVSTKEVENIIRSIKIKNSNGYNEISTKILKISSPCISSPQTHVCNIPLISRTFSRLPKIFYYKATT